MEMSMSNCKSYLLAVSIIVAGCAAQPGKGRVANTNAGPDVQCQSDQLTGSKITRAVCTTKAQRDALQAGADAVRDDYQHPGGTCRPGATC
jgi:hypothetical protein